MSVSFGDIRDYTLIILVKYRLRTHRLSSKEKGRYLVKIDLNETHLRTLFENLRIVLQLIETFKVNPIEEGRGQQGWHAFLYYTCVSANTDFYLGFTVRSIKKQSTQMTINPYFSFYHHMNIALFFPNWRNLILTLASFTTQWILFFFCGAQNI